MNVVFVVTQLFCVGILRGYSVSLMLCSQLIFHLLGVHQIGLTVVRCIVSFFSAFHEICSAVRRIYHRRGSGEIWCSANKKGAGMHPQHVHAHIIKLHE